MGTYESLSEDALVEDAEAPPTTVSGVAEDAIAGLHDVLVRLQDDLRSMSERAGLREQVISRLHEENERLRAGERNLLLKPVQADLQRLRNDLLRQAATLPDPVLAEAVRGLLASFAVSVELTLERTGVAVFRPEPGMAFDPSRHRVVEALAAASPEIDSTIAEVVGDGYLDVTSDRVLAAAAVRVWRWQPDDAAATSAVPLARPRTE